MTTTTATSMRALSLTQPWATLVALGIKTIETRSWLTSYRGVLAIHAAKGLPGYARDSWHLNCWVRAALQQAGYASVEELPRGVVLAIATLAYVYPVERIRSDLSPLEEALGDYSSGRYAWGLTGVRRPAEPVPARGALGLWAWSPPNGWAEGRRQ
jgi:hypothetical protein